MNRKLIAALCALCFAVVTPARATAPAPQKRPVRVIVAPCRINADGDKSQYTVRIVARNNKIVFTSECRHNKADAISAAKNLITELANGRWVIVDPEGDYDAKGEKLPE